jgi:glycosyltransferase involved in cell wall biosynthesis
MGGEILVYNLSRELARRGHVVDFFAVGDIRKNEEVDGICIHYVPMPWLLKKLSGMKVSQRLMHSLKIPSIFNLVFCLLPDLAIAAQAKMKQSDVVLVNYADQIFSLFVARCMNKPSILVTSALHTVWVRGLRSLLPWPSYFFRLAYSFITDYIGYALADVILVTSEQERKVALETWKHLTEEKVKVLVNAVDTEITKPDVESRATVRAKLGIPDAAIVVGFTSGMKEMTNLAAARYILHTLTREIWHDFPNVYFLIVGDYAQGSLEPPEDTRVIVTGYVDELPPYLNAIDVAIAPYRFGRGAKLKMIEAMACGKVVVATPESISAFGVNNGENALVCEIDDFSQTLKNAVCNYQTLSEMGCRAREFVEAQYSWQSVGAELVNILEGQKSKRVR